MTSGPPAGDLRRALAEGGRRFDERRFFEAHEVWEAAWRAEAGPPRLLLQALIQIAAGFHKGLVQGRPTGMVRLLHAGMSRLDAVTAAAPGLTGGLAGFEREVVAWREAARAWAGGGPRPERATPRLGGWAPASDPGV